MTYNVQFFYSSIGGSTHLSERAKLFPLEPRIVVTYAMYVDNIGNNIVLPCRVKGHPKPRVLWVDSKGENVKKDPRMKVYFNYIHVKY